MCLVAFDLCILCIVCYLPEAKQLITAAVQITVKCFGVNHHRTNLRFLFSFKDQVLLKDVKVTDLLIGIAKDTSRKQARSQITCKFI